MSQTTTPAGTDHRDESSVRSVNLVVSNAPGPPTPLYLFTAVADAQHRADVEVFTQGVRTALGDLTRKLARAAS